MKFTIFNMGALDVMGQTRVVGWDNNLVVRVSWVSLVRTLVLYWFNFKVNTDCYLVRSF